MSDCTELNIIRKKLVEALGDKAAAYFQHMKLWFQMKATKGEFDAESRKMMTEDQIHLHNQFLLCLFSKCQSLALSQSSSISRSDSGFTSRRSDKCGFEPADTADYVPQLHSLPPHAYDEPPRYCTQELFLPDTSLVFGRFLVAAWERDLEGVDESAAEYLVVAVQHLLKNVLTAVLSRKNGYKIREGCFMYGMGSSVPNPWRRNTIKVVNYNRVSRPEINGESDGDEDDYYFFDEPLKKPTLEDVEQKAAFEIACGCDNVKTPVTVYHILQALQVYPHIIPSQGVYSVYIEKVINKLRHPSREEIEAGYVS
ncbi:hypothetical protein R5R35_001512 [Gryllus longicercus]|uniref:Transcriptional adapter 1-like protein n=1 Tax=Gryllus longicercus TaxID=2509291 RepID=A0AAN9W9Y9_9ORTH